MDTILAHFDRKSRLPYTGKNGSRVECTISTEAFKASYLLQRMLDRSKILDNYRLRKLSAAPGRRSTEEEKARLTKAIGSQHVDQFLEFCRAYYAEIKLARQGLWSPSKKALLERADLNPPHKKNILHRLVGNIIGETLEKHDLARFRQEAWLKRSLAKGSSLKGACQKIEECRKNFGNLFNERLRRLKYRIETMGESEKTLKGDDKAIWSAWDKTQQAAGAIAEYFGHCPSTKSRYENPFSLAQLYNILETDRNGFSSTTLAAHLENTWRMSEVTIDGKKSAKCSRLPADSVRPFDGVLRRLLERQAFEIAGIKAQSIVSTDVKNCKMDIPVLIEQNRFAFSEGLVDVKRTGAKRKKLFTDKLKQQSIRWQDKDARIQAASKGFCPYTGEELGKTGETDHIIPRAQSRSSSGTIYNSEPNLIWCSRRGNQEKRDKRYHLSDLNPSYLEKQFGTTNATEIEAIIQASVSGLPDDFIFDSLTPDGQRDVRHALFLYQDNPLYRKIERRLASQMIARVNGTQAWLIRAIIQNLQAVLESWARKNAVDITYTATQISAEQVSAIRTRLSEANPEFAKPEGQPVASHAIDALCVLAAAAASPALEHTLCQGDGMGEDMEWLQQAMPEGVDVSWIERKPRYHKQNIDSQPLFKEGIFAQRFLPVWVDTKGVRIGFDYVKTLTRKGPTEIENEY